MSEDKDAQAIQANLNPRFKNDRDAQAKAEAYAAWATKGYGEEDVYVKEIYPHDIRASVESAWEAGYAARGEEVASDDRHWCEIAKRREGEWVNTQLDNARLDAEVKRLHDKYDHQILVRENERLRAALELIAAPKRPDGTYNRSREACEQLAREALQAEGVGDAKGA
jgi:hypothetical protein